MLVHYINTNVARITMASEERSESMRDDEKMFRRFVEMPPTKNLTDVFHVIPRDHFPITWNFVVRVLTILPTTVACEQSFSYFKRTVHTIMGETTATSFLFARLNLYETIFNL